MGLTLQNVANKGGLLLSGVNGRFSAKEPSNFNIPGLVLHLDANNVSSYPGSGTVWTDLSGNGNNATLVNGVSFSGGGLVFDGADDYVSVTENVGMTPAELSIAVKFKINSATNTAYLPAPSGIQYIFFRQNTNSSFDFEGFSLIFFEDYAGYVRRLQVNIGGIGIFSATQLEYGTTYHATVVIATNSIKLFVNGVEEQSVFKGSPLSYNTNHTLKIGRTVPCCGGTWDAAMNGTIYNLKMYNRVLSSSEVLENYNNS